MQVWVKASPEVVEEFKNTVVMKKGDFSRGVNEALKLYLCFTRKMLVVVKSDGYRLVCATDLGVNDVLTSEILPLGPGFHENVLEFVLSTLLQHTEKVTARNMEGRKIVEKVVEKDTRKLLEKVKDGYSLVLKLKTGIVVLSTEKICGSPLSSHLRPPLF